MVREYHYPKKDIAAEFVLRVGSRKPRADLMVFTADADHTQETCYIIVECKAQTVKSGDRKEGVGQLHSYLATCPNAVYGMWTNGLERYCYHKVVKAGQISYEEIPDLPVMARAPRMLSVPVSINSKPPHRMPCCSLFAAAITTSPATRACRSRKPSGNCSS